MARYGLRGRDAAQPVFSRCACCWERADAVKTGIGLREKFFLVALNVQRSGF